MSDKAKILPSKSLALLDAVERMACKRSFFEFVQSFWSIIIKEEPEYNWHIPYLCEELENLSYYIVNRLPKPYDIIINIPPGTTKTTIVLVMYPAWLWTQDQSIRIISNSYSKDLSIDAAIKSRDIIQCDKFRRLFPEVQLRRDKSAKSFYENSLTGSRNAVSTGSGVTGKHAHLILNDDPLNPQQAASEADRKTANDHTKILSTRKVNKENAPTITVMQRLHQKDPTGYMLAKKGSSIKHICLPAEVSNLVNPEELKAKYVDGLLDPVRLNRKVLEEAKIDLGSFGYAGQFAQTPTEEGGNIVKKEWFKIITKEAFLALYSPSFHTKHFFMDTAYTDNTKNDPSGIISSVLIGETLYVTNAKRVHMNFPSLIKFIPGFLEANEYTPKSTLRIEPKASGKSVVQQLRDSTKYNVTETPTPTDSKLTRLSTASPKIECGRVVLMEGFWNEDFIDEVTGFPNKEHDEFVDVLCYAIDFHLGKKGKSASEIANML